MNLSCLLDLLDKLERPRATVEDCSAVATALLSNMSIIADLDSTFKYVVPILQRLAKVFRVHASFLEDENMAYFLASILRETLPIVDCDTLLTIFRILIHYMLRVTASLQHETSISMLPTIGLPFLQLKLFVCLSFLIHFQYGSLHAMAADTLYSVACCLCYTCLSILERFLHAEGQSLTSAGKQLVCDLVELIVSLAMLFDVKQVFSTYSSTSLSTLLKDRNYTYTTVVYQYILRYFLDNDTTHIPAMFLSNVLKKLILFTTAPSTTSASEYHEPSVKKVDIKAFNSSKATFQDVLVCFYFFTATFCSLRASNKTPTAFAKLTNDGLQRVSNLVRFSTGNRSPIGRPYGVLILTCFLGTGNAILPPAELPFKQMHDAFIDEFLLIRGYEMLFDDISSHKTEAVYSAMFLTHLYRSVLAPASAHRLAFVLPKERIGGKIMSFQTIREHFDLCLANLTLIIENLAKKASHFVPEKSQHVLSFCYFTLLSIFGRFVIYSMSGTCVNIFSSHEAEALLHQVTSLVSTMQRCVWQEINSYFTIYLQTVNLLAITLICLTTHAGSSLGSPLPATRKVEQSLLTAITELTSEQRLFHNMHIEVISSTTQEKRTTFLESVPMHNSFQTMHVLGNCITVFIIFSISHTNRLAVVNQGLLQSAATLYLQMHSVQHPIVISNEAAIKLSKLMEYCAHPPKPPGLDDPSQSGRQTPSHMSSQRSEDELKSELQGEKLVRQQLQLQLKKAEEALSTAQQEGETRETELQSLKTIQEQTRVRISDLEQRLQLSDRELSLKNAEMQLLRDQLAEAQAQLESLRTILPQLEAKCNAAHNTLNQYREEASHLRSGMQSISLIINDYAGYLQPRYRH